MHTNSHHNQLPAIGLTCNPGALVGMPGMYLLANRVGGHGLRVHGLNLQRVLLQVFFNDIQVYFGTGGGCRLAPGPSICTHVGQIRHLNHMEAET